MQIYEISTAERCRGGENSTPGRETSAGR